MSKIEDGGPAFPAEFFGGEGSWYQDGMSLRDWFAGQALAGIHASRETARAIVAERQQENPLDAVARAAYAMADAMIKARQS